MSPQPELTPHDRHEELRPAVDVGSPGAGEVSRQWQPGQ